DRDVVRIEKQVPALPERDIQQILAEIELGRGDLDTGALPARARRTVDRAAEISVLVGPDHDVAAGICPAARDIDVGGVRHARPARARRRWAAAIGAADLHATALGHDVAGDLDHASVALQARRPLGGYASAVIERNGIRVAGREVYRSRI